MTISVDYQCRDCSNVWEREQDAAAPVQPACPRCHSTDTVRVYSAPAVAYIGEGWTGAANG